MTHPCPKCEEMERRLQVARDGIAEIIYDGVQKTEGVYSRKNNKCKHGNYGYQGCETCIEEYLEPILRQIDAPYEGEK